jgi:hypothetical protein
MAAPHIQKTLDAIKDLLFTDGRGPHYRRQLEGKLATRADEQAIDNALKLGPTRCTTRSPCAGARACRFPTA